MINPFLEVKWNPEMNELRRFCTRTLASSLSAGLAASAAIALEWTMAGALRHVRLGMFIVAAFAFVGLFWQAAARWLYRAVHGLSTLINYLVSGTILALFYFLIMSPYALCLRALKHDPLRLKPVAEKSMWQPHRQPEKVRQYYRQY